MTTAVGEISPRSFDWHIARQRGRLRSPTSVSPTHSSIVRSFEILEKNAERLSETSFKDAFVVREIVLLFPIVKIYWLEVFLRVTSRVFSKGNLDDSVTFEVWRVSLSRCAIIVVAFRKVNSCYVLRNLSLAIEFRTYHGSKSQFTNDESVSRCVFSKHRL